MKIDEKIKREALKALHKVQIAAAINAETARVKNNEIALGFWERLGGEVSNVAFLIQYGEDK